MVDSGYPYSFDFKFLDGQASNTVVQMTREAEEWNWEDFLLDQVHKIRIETDDTIGDIVRCLTFYGDNWKKVLTTGDCVRDDSTHHSSYFEMQDGWRITGVRANTSYN